MIQAHQLTKRYGDKTAVHTLSCTSPRALTHPAHPAAARAPLAAGDQLVPTAAGRTTPPSTNHPRDPWARFGNPI